MVQGCIAWEDEAENVKKFGSQVVIVPENVSSPRLMSCQDPQEQIRSR